MTSDGRIYMDYAATSPLCDEARIAMEDCMENIYGNASGIYKTARLAKLHLEKARYDIASILEARPDEIYFTSGGSESDNWALKGIAFKQSTKKHIITSMIEHQAVLKTCDFLERCGWEVTYLRPDNDGCISPDDVRDSLRPDTALVSVMWANNEIGTIEPIPEIAQITNEAGIPLHTDAVQAVGTLPVSVKESGVSLLSLSAHKFYGPKGSGVLFLRHGTAIEPLIHGGEQERGLRASTENVIGSVGMAAALKQAVKIQKSEAVRLEELRNKLLQLLTNELPDLTVNGSIMHRLPGNLHLTVPGVDNKTLIPLLDLNGVEASAGSACMAGSYMESHVLKAIGMKSESPHGTLRLTIGRDTDQKTILEAAKRIISTVKTIRGNSYV